MALTLFDWCHVADVFRIFSSIKSFMMSIFNKIVCLVLISVLSNPTPVFAGNNSAASSSSFDWAPVIDAIIMVESEGNPKAVSGNSVGAMQITPILVRECNNILKSRNSKKRYTLKDRFSVDKSKEMFLLIQSHHNATNNVERAIRSWNGGMRYSVKRTQRYYNKVMARMRTDKD